MNLSGSYLFALAGAGVLAQVVNPVVPLPAPVVLRAETPLSTPTSDNTRPPADLRGGTHESEEIVLEGSETITRSRRGNPDGSAQREKPSGPYCPPVTYVWGKYKTVVTVCDPVPVGEWAPLLPQADGNEEPGTEDVPAELLVFTRDDVQSLLVNSGSLVIQPDQSWVLVGTETIVMTDAAEHVLGAQVLDLDLEVRVTPALFTWDFGDGSVPLTGTDPGAPWPNHTVSHVYTEPGVVTISLRTEWDAAFRVEGTSTWIPVSGRAVTEAPSDPIEVVTAQPRLTTG